MNVETLKRYRYYRRVLPNVYPDNPEFCSARNALGYVREEQAMRAMLARFEDAQPPSSDTWLIACAELIDAPAGYVVRASVRYDDFPTDWGDIEPTKDEREATTSYFVSLDVIDANTGLEVKSDSIGGIDCIDLPGYLQRNADDAMAYALIEHLMPEVMPWVENEISERAYWESRDVYTVNA